MNTASAVQLCSLQVVLFIVRRQAVVVVDNSKCFTYSFTSCSEIYQHHSVVGIHIKKFRVIVNLIYLSLSNYFTILETTQGYKWNRLNIKLHNDFYLSEIIYYTNLLGCKCRHWKYMRNTRDSYVDADFTGQLVLQNICQYTSDIC